MIVLALVIGILAVGLIFGVQFVLKKQATSSVGAEAQQISQEIPALESQVNAVLESSARLVSKGQLDSVGKQIEAADTELAKEKENLKQIEVKLDEAQKQVEQKEALHQEMKSSKEEDELKLKDLGEKFNDLSTESMQLEQQLATSMKNLDQLMNDVQLSDTQRAMLDELSASLSSAGERMRDLLTEYNTVHERLELLQQQHRDLEDEYTRLVEQQLGE